MGAEYKVHTKLLTEFETLGVMGENCSGIIKMDLLYACNLDSSVSRKTPVSYDIDTFGQWSAQ